MSKVKVVSLLVFSLSSAFAQDNSNETVVYTGNTATAMSSMQACVENICPNPEASLQSVQKKIDARFFSDLDFYNGMGKKIKQLANVDIQDDNAYRKDLLAWMKNVKQIKDPSAIKLYQFFKIFASLSDAQYKAQGGYAVVDRPLSFKNLNLSPAEATRYGDVLDRILVIFGSELIKYTDEDDIHLRYGKGELDGLINQTLDAIDADSKLLSNDPATKILMESDLAEVFDTQKMRLRLKNSRDKATLEELNSQYTFSRALKLVLMDSSMAQTLGTVPIDLQAEIKSRNLSAAVNEAIARTEALANDPNRGIKFLNACSLTYFTAQEILPSEKELAQFTSRAQYLKINFLNKIKGRLSTHSAGLVAKQIDDNWRTVLPMSRERHKALMEKMINDALVEQKDDVAKRERLLKSPARDALFATALSISTFKSGDDEWGVDATCKDMLPSILPDQAVAGAGMSVGPLIIKFGPETEGVTYHEMGHLLYRFLKSGNISVKTSADFKTTLQCLRGMHAKVGVSAPAFYESEDYADYVSSIVDQPSKNLACVFTRLVDPAGYRNYQLKQTDATDSHSSHFYRLLNIHYQKNGSLPPSCLSAIKGNAETPPFKQCK